MTIPTLPNATTPGEVAPKWFTEPAKRVAAIAGNVVFIAGTVLVIVNETVASLPEKIRLQVTAAAGTIAIVGKVAATIQGVLTRNRVYSPESVIEITDGNPQKGDQGAAFTEEQLKDADPADYNDPTAG